MPKQFARILLTGFLIAVLVFGGINMASAAKPTLTPPPGPTATPAPATPMQIFGAWHCGNHFCDWSLVRNTTPGGEFDIANHWLIDRSNGQPSVNLVALSFVNPLKMLNRTDTGYNGMVPVGMDTNVVTYFKNHGIRVMFSIGG
ncbi:MAG: hypothetical protein ABI986_14435, partial [Chloroflexota bacterium]